MSSDAREDSTRTCRNQHLLSLRGSVPRSARPARRRSSSETNLNAHRVDAASSRRRLAAEPTYRARRRVRSRRREGRRGRRHRRTSGAANPSSLPMRVDVTRAVGRRCDHVFVRQLLLVLVACNATNAATSRADAPQVPDGEPLFCGGDPCNVLNGVGCCTGKKCTWVRDVLDGSVGHVDCPPTGSIAIGERCTYTATFSAYDDCVAGAVCDGGFCKKICNLDGTEPSCPSGSICTTYDYLFGPPGMTKAAGVCDRVCPTFVCTGGASAARSR